LISSSEIRNTISNTLGQIGGAGLRAKSARAVMTLGVGTFAGNGMKFVRRMILARLLAPSEIGTMAIVMSLSTAFEALTEVGIKQAVIQNKRGADSDYLNVAWWMQVVRGCFLFLIAILSAPWLSSLYDKPELLSLLQICFLAILLRGFVSPRAYVLEKQYKFGRAVLLTQGSAVLGVIVTIGLALAIRNVWALVIGFVAEMAILCLSSFILVPLRPRFKIHRESLGELMKYARGMFGLPIFAFISFQAPILVLGKVIPDVQLGLYSYAAVLAYFPIELYSKIITPVLLPAFCEKQDDKDDLCRCILRTARWTASLVIPLIAFMVCCASELLLLAYTPQYTAMAAPFALLSLLVLQRTQGMILTSTYLALGKPHLHRRFAVLRAVTIVGLIYPASLSFGPLGAAAVMIFGNCVHLSAQVLGCRKTVGLEPSLYIRSYVPGLVLALPVIATVGFLRLFEIDSALFIVIVGFFALLLTYVTYLGCKFGMRRSLACDAGQQVD